MQTGDKPEFEAQMKLLVAAFNVPPGERVEAYWIGLQRMTLIEMARAVTFAISPDGPDKIPTPKQLWVIRNNLRSRGAPALTNDAAFASIQAQLCEYAAQHVHDRAGPKDGMTLGEYSRPWTYVYREWIDHDLACNSEGKCSECIGLVIDLNDGTRIGWSVARMMDDHEGYEKMKRAFSPGPKPTPEQIANWHSMNKKLLGHLSA